MNHVKAFLTGLVMLGAPLLFLAITYFLPLVVLTIISVVIMYSIGRAFMEDHGWWR